MSKDEDFSRYQSTYIDENAGIHFYNRNDNESIQTDRSEQLGLCLEIIYISLYLMKQCQ